MAFFSLVFIFIHSFIYMHSLQIYAISPLNIRARLEGCPLLPVVLNGILIPGSDLL